MQREEKKLRKSLEWLSQEIAKYKYLWVDDKNTEEQMLELIWWRNYLMFSSDKDKVKKFEESWVEFKNLYLTN